MKWFRNRKIAKNIQKRDQQVESLNHRITELQELIFNLEERHRLLEDVLPTLVKELDGISKFREALTKWVSIAMRPSGQNQVN